jgi:CheY-like chemotaxis protein
MTQSPMAEPRILVIEDKPGTRRLELMYLEAIHENTMQAYGISALKIDEAESVTQAEQLLKEAALRPYDLALLDLRLPMNDPDKETGNVENGFYLLKFIRENKTAKGVIVVSNYDDYKNVVPSFRGGALDFLSKLHLKQETLESRVLSALARVMAEESDCILNQRVRDLVAYAELGLAHSFKLIFANLLQGVTEAADGIEKYVRERYGLDREKDPQDSLMLRLGAHEKAIAQARQDWAGLQAELARSSKKLDVGYVGEILRDIRENLLPCLIVKKVMLDLPTLDETPVLTFEKDVEVVLREIIVGTLSELPNYEDEREIKISFTTEDTRAEVRFEDNLDPIPEGKMKAINEGQRILPDLEFGRVWGLSVAQHVALRGGGELRVAMERGRNIITYYIPLADYA